MHRYVYELEYGEIKEGETIHHIDRNKENNQISNLVKMTISEHCKLHGKLNKENEELQERLRENIKKASEKAKEWHRSEEGRRWHVQHGKNVAAKQKENKIKKICLICGKEYETLYYKRNHSKYCHLNCRAKATRMRAKLKKLNA